MIAVTADTEIRSRLEQILEEEIKQYGTEREVKIDMMWPGTIYDLRHGYEVIGYNYDIRFALETAEKIREDALEHQIAFLVLQTQAKNIRDSEKVERISEINYLGYNLSEGKSPNLHWALQKELSRMPAALGYFNSGLNNNFNSYLSQIASMPESSERDDAERGLRETYNRVLERLKGAN